MATGQLFHNQRTMCSKGQQMNLFFNTKVPHNSPACSVTTHAGTGLITLALFQHGDNNISPVEQTCIFRGQIQFVQGTEFKKKVSSHNWIK